MYFKDAHDPADVIVLSRSPRQRHGAMHEETTRGREDHWHRRVGGQHPETLENGGGCRVLGCAT